MTQDEILSESVIKEAFEIEDDIKRTIKITELQRRAKDLKCVRQFDSIIKAFNSTLEAARKAKNREMMNQTIEGITNFGGLETQLRCGEWIASDDGIVIQSKNPAYPNRLACYHPIIPKRIMQNLQTGEQQIELAFKRKTEKNWRTITVDRDVVASRQKIVALAKYGIAVTTENAQWLVSFLSDVTNLNNDSVPLAYSTSKLGWIKHNGEQCFMPYRPGQSGISFDSELRFKQVFNSIKEHGDINIWTDHVKKLRASGKMEIKVMLAASFASILLEPCDLLPFIVDLWGETEGGKTVTLMLAASVWADPSNNAYISDYKTTDTALEARADMLNSLPLILDDTSKVSGRLKQNMEGLIYDICSGKGKSRSNKALGINRENTWQLATLTCGEKPLQEYAEQGGAINRIIEIQCTEHLYEDPHKTVEIIKNNYGFYGKFFAIAIAISDYKELKKRCDAIYRKLIKSGNVMEKQANSMAAILLADQLIDELIFKDGQTISIDDAIDLIAEKEFVSDNQRAYEYIQDKIQMNEERFNPVSDKAIEQWGFRSDGGYVNFYPSALESLLEDKSFGLRSFLAWMNKRGLLEKDKDNRATKKVRCNGKNYNVYRLKLLNDDDTTGTDTTEPEQTELDLSELSGLPFDL